jgi:hypothetical protein
MIVHSKERFHTLVRIPTPKLFLDLQGGLCTGHMGIGLLKLCIVCTVYTVSMYGLYGPFIPIYGVHKYADFGDHVSFSPRRNL